MRRILVIAGALVIAGLLVALPAAGDDDGPYLVRAVFDNGSFVVKDEEVRIAGARVGGVESVDISRDDEIVSNENGGTAMAGKAIIIMRIDDDGFKDFREDAECIIRPQSLIGERYIDCKPTQPRAPGSPLPPELEQIEDGERGEGERLLPIENNGKSVDLDLIQNINRAPYRDRFRLILNDLGAALAARGDDLGAVIDRANPALRQTDRVLKILADQSDQLASLASDGDAVLQPLADNRESITSFFTNARIAGEATAERSADLEAQLQKLPRTLREVRLTMGDLKDFADQGTPLMTDIGAEAKDLSRATQKLAPFATAGIPAFETLGNAAEAAGPKLVAADPVVVDLRELTKQSGPAANNLSALLDTFAKTKGFEYLMDFIYYSTGSINSYDDFGHFLRAQVNLSSCLEFRAAIFSGCEALFVAPPATTPTKKKSKKSTERTFSAPSEADEAPESPSLGPLPPLEDLIPELVGPDDGTPPSIGPEDPADGDEDTDEDGKAKDGAEGVAPAAAAAAAGQTDAEMMQNASLLLTYLLGDPA